MQYQINSSSRNLSRGSRRIPPTIDHYEYGNRAPEVPDSKVGGQNGMLYRGGYTHDAGSFTLIHGGN